MIIIDVRFLGAFSITLEPTRQRLSLPPLAAKLFAYSLFHRRSWLSREILIEVFWPDASLERARSSLNSTLSRLRTAFPDNIGPIIIPQGRDAFSLAEDLPLSIDVDTFLRDVAIEKWALCKSQLSEEEIVRLQEALGLYRGDLLPGWYDEWLLVERERLRHRYLAGLTRLMDHFMEVDAVELAITLGQQILSYDALRESVHRSLMELFLRSGNRAAVQRQYSECTKLLETELGVAPMRETRDLYARISESEITNHPSIKPGAS